MEDVASASVLAGPSQPTFSRPSASDRRNRKSGTANIFQGVNLRQLRRLFQAAGEPDADQRARTVWGTRRPGGAGEDAADGEDEDDEDGAMAEVETGLAQALVGLRVRSRNRNGLRMESHREAAGTRWVRAFGHLRINEASQGQTSDALPRHDDDDDDDGGDDDAALGACGGQSSYESGTCDQTDFLSPEEEPHESVSGSKWSWNTVQEKDPERYLHRIRH